eukprot:6181333-Pleurochrysis_carterae.AAC.1
MPAERSEKPTVESRLRRACEPTGGLAPCARSACDPEVKRRGRARWKPAKRDWALAVCTPSPTTAIACGGWSATIALKAPESILLKLRVSRARSDPRLQLKCKRATSGCAARSDAQFERSVRSPTSLIAER